MDKNTISRKEQRLKELEEQIKKEKRKLNEKLGKAIIDTLKFGYDTLDNHKINEICNILKTHYDKEVRANERTE